MLLNILSFFSAVNLLCLFFFFTLLFCLFFFLWILLKVISHLQVVTLAALLCMLSQGWYLPASHVFICGKSGCPILITGNSENNSDKASVVIEMTFAV